MHTLESTCHPVTRRPKLTLVTLCLAVLVAQIDTAIVNLAATPVGMDFDTDVQTLQWFIDSYNLVYAVLLMTGGLMADIYGRRRIFMAGAAVFAMASLLCALAPTMALLIGGRALTGLGAALLLPASLAIIRVAWPDAAKRNRALGIWTACNGLAMAIGPALGGWLIHHAGWRSIFVIVIPFSVEALVLAAVSIPESAHPDGRRFDLRGQLLAAWVLGALALAGIEMHAAPGLAAAILLTVPPALLAFVRVERTQGQGALVPLDLLLSPVFRGVAGLTAAMTFGMYGLLFLLPLNWLARGEMSSVQAGAALLPMALVFLLVSACSGSFLCRLGQRRAIVGGIASISLGLLAVSAGSGVAAAGNPSVLVEAGLALTGLGMGLATGPLMAVAIAAVAAKRSGTASALINVARMAGATLGVAMLGAVYAWAGQGVAGLRLALLLAAALQLACLAILRRRLPA